MTKGEALHQFWSSFGWTAIDENSAYDRGNAPDFPYITYSVSTDSLDNTLDMNASLWDRSTSWKAVSEKAEEIADYIVKMYPPSIKIDGGRLYIAKGRPFAQRMGDPDDDRIRRIYLNIQAEFLTAS